MKSTSACYDKNRKRDGMYKIWIEDDYIHEINKAFCSIRSQHRKTLFILSTCLDIQFDELSPDSLEIPHMLDCALVISLKR